MATPLIECIPNFSEARNPKVIEAITDSIRTVSDVQILDQHSDLDHNRTVITLLGAPQAVEEAAFQAIKKAAELINMDKHTGAHPRIGATDVVPFVPIREVSMNDCVEIARRLGRRVGSELKIPVYLYEEAATCPDRVNLENIRRGQYEGLKAEIKVNPERAADFGPAELGKAGATVIGARQPLIAFNVYLTSDNVEIAKKIARRVRFSSGGLRFIKAMGVLVEGRVQVSMNLTNYRKTSIASVVEMIRREAQRYGIAVHHSELVGLIPQEALINTAVWYAQLDQFAPHQILEYKLQERGKEPVQKIKSQEYSFLDDLASSSPTPGGGSAAAFTAAEAAALVAMVGRLTVGKKKYASVKQEMFKMVETAESLRQSLMEAVVNDAEAFKKVMAAYKLPKDTPGHVQERKAAVQSVTYHAAKVPLKTGQSAVKVLELSLQAATKGNMNAITDAGTAAALAYAALAGAGANVRINLSALVDKEKAQQLESELAALEEKALKLRDSIHNAVKERSHIHLL
ncbi:MAG TPA: glutamate formimidoyltransferase [Anaerolineae bacterium]|nr:glutamate formimidoyltransferase [Anaerolineae bacterium]